MDRTLPLACEVPDRSPLARMEAALVDALHAADVVDASGVAEARARQAEHGGRLSSCLVELGLVSDEELLHAFGRAVRVPCTTERVALEGGRELVSLLGREEVEKYRLLPFSLRSDAVLVATCEPWRLALFEELAEHVHRPIQPCFLDEGPIARVLEALYEIPAAARFRERPELRTRPRLGPLPGTAPPEPAPELMSETAFEAIYQAAGSGSRRTPGSSETG